MPYTFPIRPNGAVKSKPQVDCVSCKRAIIESERNEKGDTQYAVQHCQRYVVCRV